MNRQIVAFLSLLISITSCKKENNFPENQQLEAKLQKVADSMRLEINELVGFPIPGIHLYIDGPKGNFFVSSTLDSSKKITQSHWFRFASFTKHFTSVAILNMEEDGWLNINDTITSFIPGTAIPYVPNTPEWDIPFKKQITIKQLMSHTAGVYDSDNEIDPVLGEKYTDFMLSLNPNHTFTTEDFTLINKSRNLSYFTPGTGYAYTNVGYSMLATIISRVYSQKVKFPRSFSDYMQEVIVPAVPSSKNFIRFPDNANDNRIPLPGVNGMIYNGRNDTISITTYNPTILIGQGNGQGTIKAVHDWFRNNVKGNGVLSLNTVRKLYNPFTPDYSNSEYTFGAENIGNLGIGHSGARAGNLCFVIYNKSTDVSILGYLPFWDLTDNKNSFINNNLVPLYVTMELLVDEYLK